MLTRLYVDNFLCLTNFELTLNETNVLLGTNGSGKTSVLDALSRLQNLVARGAKIEEVLPATDMTLSQNRDEQRFELDLESGEDAYHYTLLIQHHRARRSLRIGEESLTHNDKLIFDFKEGEAQLYHDDYSEGRSYPFDWSRSGLGALNERRDNQKLTGFKRAISNFIIVGPCPPLFKPETRSEDEFLDWSMKNFVGWYRHAAQENMRGNAELFEALREAIPGFDSISLTESGENSRALKVDFRRSDDGLERVGLSQLSDGQRMLVALYSLLYLSSGRGASLFLDEPDNYLALREIQPWLTAVDQACGGDNNLEQAVVVSHHPVTIDYMAGAKGRWFRRDGIGPVRVSAEPDQRIEGLPLSELMARGWER